MNYKAGDRKNGFTLIELIIAITILSFIAVIIGNAFRLGIRAWERGEKETEDSQLMRALPGLLSQQIKSFYPYRMKMENKDEDVVVFKGEPDSVIFVTTLTDASFGGAKWVKYTFRDGKLFYKEGLLPDRKFEEKVQGGDDEEIVDAQIGDCEFSYLSTDDDEWKEKWDFGDDPPGAVKIKLADYQPFVVRIPVSLYENDTSTFEEKEDDESL